MRFLHTADWHLGRTLSGYDLIDDQAFVLDQIVEIARSSSLDAVIIAGDLYDRAVPPPEAVELLDDTLFRLTGLGLPVIAIAGNHDSPRRLSFGARLMAERGLHLITGPAPQTVPLGDIEFVAMAYVEPAAARHVLDANNIFDHATAMARLLATIPIRDVEQVFVGHLFLGGGSPSESERPLSIGGADQVPASLFDRFDYAALGHLHAPQKHLGGKARYSGSILKYSTSEAAHTKSVSIVDLAHELSVEEILLAPKRDLRIVRGLMTELIQLPKSDDYIRVTLQDDRPVLDSDARLRVLFPNLLGIDRPLYTPSAVPRREIETGRAMEDLFEDFHHAMTGTAIDPALKSTFGQMYDSFQANTRESLA